MFDAVTYADRPYDVEPAQLEARGRRPVENRHAYPRNHAPLGALDASTQGPERAPTLETRRLVHVDPAVYPHPSLARGSAATSSSLPVSASNTESIIINNGSGFDVTYDGTALNRSSAARHRHGAGNVSNPDLLPMWSSPPPAAAALRAASNEGSTSTKTAMNASVGYARGTSLHYSNTAGRQHHHHHHHHASHGLHRYSAAAESSVNGLVHSVPRRPTWTSAESLSPASSSLSLSAAPHQQQHNRVRISDPRVPSTRIGRLDAHDIEAQARIDANRSFRAREATRDARMEEEDARDGLVVAERRAWLDIELEMMQERQRALERAEAGCRGGFRRSERLLRAALVTRCLEGATVLQRHRSEREHFWSSDVLSCYAALHDEEATERRTVHRAAHDAYCRAQRDQLQREEADARDSIDASLAGDVETVSVAARSSFVTARFNQQLREHLAARVDMTTGEELARCAAATEEALSFRSLQRDELVAREATRRAEVWVLLRVAPFEMLERAAATESTSIRHRAEREAIEDRDEAASRRELAFAEWRLRVDTIDEPAARDRLACRALAEAWPDLLRREWAARTALQGALATTSLLQGEHSGRRALGLDEARERVGHRNAADIAHVVVSEALQRSAVIAARESMRERFIVVPFVTDRGAIERDNLDEAEAETRARHIFRAEAKEWRHGLLASADRGRLEVAEAEARRMVNGAYASAVAAIALEMFGGQCEAQTIHFVGTERTARDEIVAAEASAWHTIVHIAARAHVEVLEVEARHAVNDACSSASAAIALEMFGGQCEAQTVHFFGTERSSRDEIVAAEAAAWSTAIVQVAARAHLEVLEIGVRRGIVSGEFEAFAGLLRAEVAERFRKLFSELHRAHESFVHAAMQEEEAEEAALVKAFSNGRAAIEAELAADAAGRRLRHCVASEAEMRASVVADAFSCFIRDVFLRELIAREEIARSELSASAESSVAETFGMMARRGVQLHEQCCRGAAREAEAAARAQLAADEKASLAAALNKSRLAKLDAMARKRGRPFLGIQLAEKQTHFSRHTSGAPDPLHIDAIYRGGPAYEQGVRLGDEVIRVAGAEVTSLAHMRHVMQKSVRVGGMVTLVIRRAAPAEGAAGIMEDHLENSQRIVDRTIETVTSGPSSVTASPGINASSLPAPDLVVEPLDGGSHAASDPLTAPAIGSSDAGNDGSLAVGSWGFQQSDSTTTTGAAADSGDGGGSGGVHPRLKRRASSVTLQLPATPDTMAEFEAEVPVMTQEKEFHELALFFDTAAPGHERIEIAKSEASGVGPPRAGGGGTSTGNLSGQSSMVSATAPSNSAAALAARRSSRSLRR